MRDDAKNYVSQCRRLHGHRKVPTGMLRRVCKNRFLNAVEAIFTEYASICGTLKVRLRCISAGENNE
jgi:hypothetical protein